MPRIINIIILIMKRTLHNITNILYQSPSIKKLNFYDLYAQLFF